MRAAAGRVDLAVNRLVLERVVDSWGRGEGAGVELAGVPVLGESWEYGDTGRFSGDTSVFAHGAKVTVPKTVVDPWGWGRGSNLRGHFKIIIQNSSCVVCHRVQPL